MDSGTVGLIGGICGGIIGTLGGVIGTYFSVKNTAGPRERAFVVRICVLGWLAVTAFVAAVCFSPLLVKTLLWVLYALLFPLSVHFFNAKQHQIRREEAADA